LLAEAGLKFAQRDFDGAIAAAGRVLGSHPTNREALGLMEKAAGKKATQPLVEASRGNAERAIARGDLVEGRHELERIRALDPDSPALAAVEQLLTATAARPSTPAPGAPEFSLDQEEPEEGGGLLPPTQGETGAFGGPNISPELEAISSHPASFTEISPPGEFEGSFSLDPPTAGEEALVPPPPPSPDLFVSPEKAGAPGDFLEPASDDDESRAAGREIAGLLKQGDEASGKGDRQGAIEIWSRVFLIDINNSEAVTRIEKARQDIAEEGRLVADLIKKGRESFESGDREAAGQFFRQAQSLDPNDPTAKVYLERIEQEAAQTAAVAVAGSAPRGSVPAEEAMPEPSVAPPPAPRRKAGIAVNPRVLVVIGAFLALTLVGVYFVFKGRATEPPAKALSTGALQHARDLLSKGKVAEARAELRRIGPGDPDSEEARRMLAELGKAGPAVASGKAAILPADAAPSSKEIRSETEAARLRAAGDKALAEKRYIEALKNFNLASTAYRDDPTFAQAQGLAADKVTALTPAVKFYNEGEYETAIPILWRIVQEDRDNQDARSYLQRAYYNQGITQLQNGLYAKASQAFQEAIGLDANDTEAARHRKFAERYKKGDLDLMGRIYVRHLNRRP
jgi:tetratricopeptide (TPR) repeat protein